MDDLKSHTRVNDILLGPLERPALRWLSAHMPGWVTPDLLTFIGFLGALLTGVSYWASNYHRSFLWLACLGFFINWFGDSLDGTLARYRNIQRPRYGFFIDHVVDAFAEVIIFLGLGLSPYMRFDVACLTLIAYLMMAVLIFVQTIVFAVFRLSYLRLGPTEIRLIAVIGTILMYFFGAWSVVLPWGKFTILDFIGIGLSILMVSVFVVTTLQQARRLAKLGE